MPIFDFISNAAGSLGDAAQNPLDGLADAIPGADIAQGATESLGNLGDAVTEAGTTITEGAQSAIEDITSGLGF